MTKFAGGDKEWANFVGFFLVFQIIRSNILLFLLTPSNKFWIFVLLSHLNWLVSLWVEHGLEIGQNSPYFFL